MVKHIVLYTFKEGVNKEDAITVIRDSLYPLVGKIPGLHGKLCCASAPRGSKGELQALYRYPCSGRL